jgi:hypothetical protein
MSSEPAIEISHLTKYYGKREIVRDLCLKIPKGSIYGFLGRNALGSERLCKDLERQWGQNRKGTLEVIQWSSLASVASAGLTAFWAWRSSFSRHRILAWAALGLAFNLAGLLVFRLAADWPLKLACPSCRTPRSAEQDACPGCSNVWEGPAASGVEIFEKTSA